MAVRGPTEIRAFSGHRHTFEPPEKSVRHAQVSAARPTLVATEGGAMIQCACCFLFKFEAPVSPTDKAPHVCPDCVRHYGRHDRMNADHLEAWQEHHKTVVTDLRGRLRHHIEAEQAAVQLAEDRRIALSDATRAYADGFFSADNVGPELRKALASDVNEKNLNLARSAFRLRDRVMNVVLAIADLHDERADGRCRCGSAIAKCAEYQSIRSELPDAFKWENEQIRRMRDGLDHGLRKDHPEAKKFLEHHPHDLWHGLPTRLEGSRSLGRH